MTATIAPPALDEQRIEQFAHQIIGDLGAAMSSVLIRIGDRLGLYRLLGDSEPTTSIDLAIRADLSERYVREWLHNQAAAGWVTYDPETVTFTLPPEHAALVSDENSPSYLLGGFDFIAAAWADEEKLASAFRTGDGIGWHQHDARLFSGTERFFRPGYQTNLVSSWVPALDGVAERLEQGIRVADVGCGYGAATVLLAQAYPRSSFVGFDYHDASIAAARRRAAEAGVESNLTFEVASAKDFTGDYDLICLFDCLHDMGDPVGAARWIRQALRPGGSMFLVEPAGTDRPEDSHNLLGRLLYACSTAICLPGSLAQEGQLGLGNQVGPTRQTEILNEAGFSSVRVAARTPINAILDVRP